MDNDVNYDLTDEQWKRIQPLLPLEYTRKKGRPKKDNRIEQYALDKSQRSAMEITSKALRSLAKRLCPIRQVAG